MKKFIAAVVIAGLVVPAAFAHQGWHRGHHGRGSIVMKRMADELGLTEAQRAQIREIRKGEREKNRQLFSDFRAKRRELRQLRRADDPRAGELEAELKAMREQLRAARQATHEKVLGVLTPEQRQKLEQMRARRRA
ncbi:MAG TPA: Spy/CpxP family protein refolding chaperone [Thermoanaerobaculia bacterium]|nr:Spy/CpxP family protein refolding chaperone [Thermoanaerobaculia bacterium]